jgi:hypothetical protein
MTLLPPDVQAWLDQEDEHTAQIIRLHGVYIEYVHGDAARRSPAFAYTVGLFGLRHPELLVFDSTPESAAGVLNSLAAHVRAGGNLLPGQEITSEGSPSPIMLEHVPNPGEIVFAANRYYQRPAEASVPVLQLTYADDKGRYPWQKGYARPGWRQPRPGRFHA